MALEELSMSLVCILCRQLSMPMEPPELSQRPQTKTMVERLEEEVKSLKAALAAKNKARPSPLPCPQRR